MISMIRMANKRISGDDLLSMMSFSGKNPDDLLSMLDVDDDEVVVSISTFFV